MSEFDIETSATLGSLFAALAKAQGELTSAKKDAFNPHFKSKFADLASVIEACKGPLTKNDLCVVQVAHSKDADGVTIITTLAHKSGEWMRGRLYMPNTKKDAQGMGSAITYGRRYSYQAMVGLAAEEDDDGNEAAKAPRTPVVNAASSKALAAGLEQNLRDAKSKDELKKVAKNIALAYEHHNLTEEDRMALAVVYKECEKAFAEPKPGEAQ